MKNKKGFLFVAFAVLIAAACFLIPISKREYRVSAPYPYQMTIEREAGLCHVDSSLIAAIIRNESKFRKTATSERGARGLMQLMPETASWIAEELGDAGYTVEKLAEVETNIRYGTWYIAHLLKMFEGDETLALAAYNAGATVVAEWAAEHNGDAKSLSIDNFPYPETRHFVRRVKLDRDNYKKLEQRSKKNK